MTDQSTQHHLLTNDSVRHDEALRMQGISRSFPGVKALQNVDFTVLSGEVHALVGENGAGKSTLMAVAAGSLPPDSGSVWIGGEELELGAPKSARGLGLRIVRQHPAVVPDLTVGENLALGVDPSQRVLRNDVNDWAQAAMSGWGMKIDPRQPVGETPLPQQFVLEITKATLGNPKVLILDEPTEHLAAADVDLLFDVVQDLRAKGAGIVYISHRIPEVQRFTSRLTVLRDGQIRGTFATGDISETEIVTLALGRSLAATFPPKSTTTGRTLLEVKALSGRDFTNVDLHVSEGEMLGLAGIDGSGQRGVLSAIAGTEPARGSVQVDGTAVRLNSIRHARGRGVSYVPDDRHHAGLFMSDSVGNNVMAGVAPRYTQFGFFNWRKLNSRAREVTQNYGVKTPSLATPIRNLSGGNQQKVMIARANLEEPRVLVADEPTQGVDAGARVQIYQALRDQCDNGSAVVVLSSDAVEMAGLCDRVVVFSRGHVVRELQGDQLTAHAITESSLTSTVLRGSTATKQRRDFLAGARGWLPSVVIGVALVILGIIAASVNSRYATTLNLSNILTLFAPLALVAMGQLFVLILGGIDLSVGPVMGLTVVALSFTVPGSGGMAGLLIGLITAIAVGIGAGLVNGLLIAKVGISPVVATLATYMAALGIGLIARPSPGGIIPNDFIEVIQGGLGPVPVAAILVIGLAIMLEVALRRTGWGMRLRAAGSDPNAAGSMGINITRVRLFGYGFAALFAALAGVLLAAQTGIGDPSSGTSFTFASVTAVILGGASIYGGRGSFVGALLGAALVAQIDNVTTFLRLSSAWQYWLLAILTIGAAAIYSRIGRTSS